MKLEGIIPAMVTPMKGTKINEEATYQHIDMLIEKGVHALFILGTNGEFHVLSKDEKLHFAKIVIDYVNGRVPVYVGVGECGTKETIDLAKKMEPLGPDAISIITPFLVPISQEELIEHYQLIAEAVEVPMILYNIPNNTNINIEPETVKELLKIDQIIGIKDSSGNLENTQGYLDAAEGTDFSVLMGSDSRILKGLEMGVTGAVASTSNAIPEHILDIYNSFHNNDLERAEKLQEEVDIIRAVTKHSSIPGMIKRIVTVAGNDVGEARRPVAEVGDQYDEEIKDMLKKYNLLD